MVSSKGNVRKEGKIGGVKKRVEKHSDIAGLGYITLQERLLISDIGYV